MENRRGSPYSFGARRSEGARCSSHLTAAADRAASGARRAPAAAERHAPGLVTVAARRPVGVIAAPQTADIVDLFDPQLGVHPEPHADAQRQQVSIAAPASSPDALLRALRQRAELRFISPTRRPPAQRSSWRFFWSRCTDSHSPRCLRQQTRPRRTVTSTSTSYGTTSLAMLCLRASPLHDAAPGSALALSELRGSQSHPRSKPFQARSGALRGSV